MSGKVLLSCLVRDNEKKFSDEKKHYFFKKDSRRIPQDKRLMATDAFLKKGLVYLDN